MRLGFSLLEIVIRIIVPIGLGKCELDDTYTAELGVAFESRGYRPSNIQRVSF